MQLLIVNSGSSSLKLAIFSGQAGQLECLASERLPKIEDNAAHRLKAFIDAHLSTGLDAVVHRIVHAGDKFTEPCIIDNRVEQSIAKQQFLAPLHNPMALKWVHACQRAFGEELPQVAVFDTALYRELPAVAQHYALPHRWTARHPVRRFGFHGLAHQALWQRWNALNPKTGGKGRIISLQLGSGCSITAVRDGKVVDTSMGFSPLEGLVMATRGGDLDPGLLLYLQEQENLSPKAMYRELNQRSGLLGISNISGDMRELLASSEPRAQMAIDLYCYRARKYIGAYFAVLGGFDAILFGGGVGENAPEIRKRILQDLSVMGIGLDTEANENASEGDTCISTPQSPVATWVLRVDESAIMAQQASVLLTTQ